MPSLQLLYAFDLDAYRHRIPVSRNMSEHAPLLPSTADAPPIAGQQRKRPARMVLVVLALIAACIFIGIRGEKGLLPKDSMKRAQYILANSPVLDGHVDLPELARTMYANNLDRFDLRKPTVCHQRRSMTTRQMANNDLIILRSATSISLG